MANNSLLIENMALEALNFRYECPGGPCSADTAVRSIFSRYDKLPEENFFQEVLKRMKELEITRSVA